MLDSYDNATIWYLEQANRFFIFHQDTFLQLPALEREDGIKLIMKNPNDIFEMEEINHEEFKLHYVGEL